MSDSPAPERRVFFWVNASALLVLAGGVALTLAYPAEWRIAGLTIVALLVLTWMIFGRTSQRAFGYATLATAGVTMAIATWIARDDWPMGPMELAVLALSMGTGALAFIFYDNRTNEPEEGAQNAAGWLVLFGLVSVAVAAMLVSFTSFAAAVPFILAGEALGALADTAGERWRTPLAVGAIVPMAALIFQAAPPQDRATIVAAWDTASSFVTLHSNWDMLWVLPLGFLAAFTGAYQRTQNARGAALAGLLLAAGAWLLVVLADVQF